ncbi:MAG: hypothetical protein WBL27_00590 [Salinimicrobium sp.]
MKKILLLCFVLVLFSCREEAKQATSQNSTSKKSFSEQLEVNSNRRVNLLPEAQAEVSEWLAYATAQDEISNLRERSGTEIMANAKNLVQIMESLRTTLPDTLQTPAVIARTNVLLTKARVLQQVSAKKHKNADEVFELANDLLLEFGNFKLQLNELFLKAPADFEKELDEQFEEARQNRQQEQEDTLNLLQPTGRE